MVVICIDLRLKWYLPNCFFFFFLIYCNIYIYIIIYIYTIDYNNRQFLDFANLQDSCCFLASGRHVAHRGQCEACRCRQHWRFDARVRRPRPFQPCGTVGAVGCAAHAGKKGHWKVKSWESRSGFGITIWFCDIRNILVKWQYRFIGQSLRKPRGLGRAHEFVTFNIRCVITHRIHVWYIYIYANIWGILMGFMLPYIAYMDPMGLRKLEHTFGAYPYCCDKWFLFGKGYLTPKYS